MAHSKKPERTAAPEAKDYHKHHEPQEDAAGVETEADEPAEGSQAPAKGKHLQFFDWCKAHKKISIPAATALLLAVFFAIPFTRYAALGLFLKQDFPVVIVDSQTGKPVSSAQVSLNGKTASTDGKGETTLHVRVGSSKLTVSKTYYKTVVRTVTVTVGRPNSALSVKLEATGRVVPLTVTNRVSGKPIQNAKVTAGSAEAKTDDQGHAALVIPAGQAEAKATVTADGYNKSDVTVHVDPGTGQPNEFALVPSGKMFFLSDQSGKIDVVKTDLDGSNRETLLAGTGKEDRFNTVLLASRDWKHIALLSKRDGGDNQKLFLIETSTGKLTTMDEGNADFQPIGWSGTTFIYTVTRNSVQGWEPKHYALKGYDASSKKLSTYDETKAEGWNADYAYEYFGSVYILDQNVVYTKNWQKNSAWFYSFTYIDGKQATFNTLDVNTGQKKVLKNYDRPSYHPHAVIDTRTSEFGEIYIRYDNGKGAYGYHEYRDGKINPASLTDNDYNNDVYPSYVVSPSGKKTLWSVYADGKLNFWVGDASGENGKRIGASSDFAVYGWYTDDYVLMTKKGSEMWIMPADGLDKGVDGAFKISDYYKPGYYLNGFGYGYGG